MKTILVIRSSAMGDVAMTSPVVDALLKNYPEVKVVMLTRKFFEPFFTENERLEIFGIELHGRHEGFGGIRRLYRELTNGYHFDLVVDLHGKVYSELLCLFFKLGGTKTIKINKGRAEKRALTNADEKSMKQLKSTVSRYEDTFIKGGFTVNVTTALSRQSRPIPSIFGTKEANAKWIGIAPFAQHRGKMLDIETVQRAMELIAEKIPEVTFFIFGGGESEAEIAAEIERKLPACQSAIGKVKLREELDLIANLDLMISMDSSAMHMASLMGVRTISVWGATHPFAGFLGIGQLPEDIVQIEKLDCRPCSVYGNKPCHRSDYACLTMITPSMILEKVLIAIA